MANFCRYCGTKLSENAVFCKGCGKAVPKSEAPKMEPPKQEVPRQDTCKGCGRVLNPGAAFCKYCGRKTEISGTQVNSSANQPVNQPVNQPASQHGYSPTSPLVYPKKDKPSGNQSGNAAYRQQPYAPQSAPVPKRKSGLKPVIAVALVVAIFVCFIYPGSVRKKLFNTQGGGTSVVSGVKPGGNNGGNPGHSGKESNDFGKTEEELAREYALIDAAYADGTLFAEDAEPSEPRPVYDWFYTDDGSESDSEDTDEPETVTMLPEGKSKPFTKETPYGITISAEENELDKDREFKLEPLTEEEYEKIDGEIMDAVGCPGLLVGAWELDAGLGDDEVLPGNYKVDIDLKKFGLEEADYPNIKVCRINDAGQWSEYQTSLNGDTVTVESNQNSMFVVVAVLAGIALIDPTVGTLNGANFNPFTGKFDLYYEDKAVMEIKVERSSIFKILKEETDQHYKDIEKSAQKEVYLQMKKEEAPLLDNTMTYNPARIEKLAKDPNTAEAAERIQRNYIRRCSEKIKEKLAADEDYTRVEENLKGYYSSRFKIPEVRTELEVVDKVKDAALRSWGYLKSLGVRMPNYKLQIDISDGNSEAYGALSPTYLVNPYIIIYARRLTQGDSLNYDRLLCTMCHEMFHAVQRRYVTKIMSNLKFDEMTAQDLECMAYDYFKNAEKDPITSSKSVVMDNLRTVKWFAVPLNDIKTTYPEGTLASDDESSESYSLAPFVTYLREQKNTSYWKILPKYHYLPGKRATTTILKAVFDMESEADLTEYHRKFAEYYQTNFYKEALQDKPDTVFSPLELIRSSEGKKKIQLLNKNYTIRVRRAFVYHDRKEEEEGDWPEYCMVIKYDESFKDMMSDFSIIPLNITRDKEYRTFKNGILFKPEAFVKNDNALYLMEVDGGTAKTTEGWFSNDYSGYTMYVMEKPDKPTASLTGSKVSVTLPELGQKAAHEIIDGYVITLRVGKKNVHSEWADKKALSRDPVKEIDLSQCRLDGNKLTQEELGKLTLVIQECVEGTSEDKEPCLGPESDEVVVSSNTIFGTWEFEAEVRNYNSPMLDSVIGSMGDIAALGGEGSDMLSAYIDQYTSESSAQANTTSRGKMIIRPADGKDMVEVVMKYEQAPESVFLGQYNEEYGELNAKVKDTSYTDSSGATYDLNALGLATEIRFKFTVEANSKDPSHPIQKVTGESSMNNEIVSYDSVLTGTKISDEY